MPTPRALKLRDLARQVGVHPSTASRALSGDPRARLSPATRARVLDLAAQTGYRPNRLARSLKKQRTHILGMLIPDVTNPLFASLFRAVEDAAGAAGYSVILCNTDDRDDRFDHHLRTLGEGHVDGLLIATSHREDAGVSAVEQRGMPYVLVNRRRTGSAAAADAWVVGDDRVGAHLAVEHLVALGHTRIAHLAGPPDVSTTADRLAGFQEAMASHGLIGGATSVAHGGLTEASGLRGMAQLLEGPPNRRPTAVFVANDFAALGAIAAARAAGLRVPADLSIVGFNDSALAQHCDPPLTSVRVPVTEMGHLSAQVLMRHLDRLPGAAEEAPVQAVLPVALVIRGSTAPPAADASPTRAGPASYPGRSTPA